MKRRNMFISMNIKNTRNINTHTKNTSMKRRKPRNQQRNQRLKL